MIKRNLACPMLHAALCVLLLAACAAQPAAPPLRQEQRVDGLTIALEAAESAELNTAQEFLVTLTDAAGQPVDDASVYLDLTMPAMPMGTNRPIAEALGEGRYRASAAYTMAGAWEIAVIAAVDGVEHRAIFTRDIPE